MFFSILLLLLSSFISSSPSGVKMYAVLLAKFITTLGIILWLIYMVNLTRIDHSQLLDAHLSVYSLDTNYLTGELTQIP